MIFLGIKYEPLSDPPLSLKFVSGVPRGSLPSIRLAKPMKLMELKELG